MEGIPGTASGMAAGTVPGFQDGLIYGFQVGVFTGLQALFLALLVSYLLALKDEGRLKKLYIQENYERRKLIQDKIGGTGFNFAMGSIATATVVSGFFHQLVFIALLCVLIFIVLVKGSLIIYYKNNF